MAEISGILPLFCQGSLPSYSQAILPLSLTCGNSGVFASLPLFVPDSSGHNSLTASLHLWTQGHPVPVSGILSLFAEGDARYLTGSLDLFAANSGVVSALNLYASGQGSMPGATPYYGTLSLYLHRPEAAALNLFCQGPPYAVSGSLYLFADANASLTGELNLAVPSSVGISFANIHLSAGGI